MTDITTGECARGMAGAGFPQAMTDYLWNLAGPIGTHTFLFVPTALGLGMVQDIYHISTAGAGRTRHRLFGFRPCAGIAKISGQPGGERTMSWQPSPGASHCVPA